MRNTFKKYFIPHEGNEFHPHFFREEAFAVVLVISLGLLITSLGSSFVVKKTNLLGNVYSSALVDLANQDRVEQKLPTLALNTTLQKAAELKAEDMVTGSYFAHTSPTGLTPWHWFNVAGYNFSYAGENLAIDFSESADVNTAWLESPLHRANILNNNFTEIGIATKDGMYNGKPTTFVVQMFGKQKKSAVIPVSVAEPKILEVKNPEQALAINANLNPSPDTNLAEVKGVNAESNGTDNVTIIHSDQTYMVFTSIDDAFVGIPDPVLTVSQPKSYTTWSQKFFLNEPHIIQIAFTILMLIVFIALLLFVTIEAKIHHNKQVALGFMMLGIIIILTFVNQSFLITPHLLFN